MITYEYTPWDSFSWRAEWRRAALAAGPDVWEVIGLLRDLDGMTEERIATTAALLGLARTQVEATTRYYAEFTDEIDAEIEHNKAVADHELFVWENEHGLLPGEASG